MNFATVTITISATYNLNDLKADIQGYYTKAAIKDEGLLWLFTEGQITNERFLVYINDLLASGEIADLYTSDEKDGIINNVRSKVKADGIVDTRDNCWQWFIDVASKNCCIRYFSYGPILTKFGGLEQGRPEASESGITP